MTLAAIIEFIKALPAMLKVLGEINDSLKQLHQEAIDKELEAIKKEVDTQIQILEGAHTDEERKKALLALSRATAR